MTGRRVGKDHRTPNPNEIPPAVGARAITSFYFESPTGCHVSTYSAGSHGYSQVGWQLPRAEGEKPKITATTAHRAAWTLVYGPIPEGMTIDHMCKTKRCVNVEHLRMLSNFENARRTSGRDWPLGQCINGHPNSELRDPEGGGKRYCAACRRERAVA